MQLIESISLIFDEVGSQPAFCKAVCSAQARMSTFLRDHFKLPQLRVRIVLCGTGLHPCTFAPGSSPSSFKTLHTSDTVWSTISKRHVYAPIARAVSHGTSTACVTARSLLTNARCAAEFARRWQEMVSGRFTPWPDAVLPSLLVFSMQRYKSLNAWGGLSEALTVKCLTDGLTIAMRSGTKAISEDEQNTYCCKLGMLEDRASVIPLATASGNRALYDIIEEYPADQQALVMERSVCRRYAMTPAMVQMALSQFGAAPRPSLGDGFEQCAMDLLTIVFAAPAAANSSISSGPGWLVEDHIRVLQHIKSLLIPDTCVVERLVCADSTPVATGNDLFKKAPKRKELANGLKSLYKDNRTVILMRTLDKSPYADIVVLVPNGGVLLVQCKHDPSTVLSAKALTAELDKMVDGKTNHSAFVKWLRKNVSRSFGDMDKVFSVVLHYGHAPEDPTAVRRNTFLLHVPTELHDSAWYPLQIPTRRVQNFLALAHEVRLLCHGPTTVVESALDGAAC
jgi:hypothetical protein